MKSIFTCLCVIVLTLPAFSQQYSVGIRAQTFVDYARGNRSVPADIYYPAADNGSNMPLPTGNDSFPIVVFGHGFLIPTAAYTWLADSLAKRGYVVVLPATEGGLLPNHGSFGADLAFLSVMMSAQNDSTTSIFYNRLIKKVAVGGHSMGGGASFLAAQGFPPSINALFNFAAAETSPSATAAAALVNKPTLIFCGSGDCIASPAVQQAMYNNLSGICKTYIDITGAVHCQFANNNFICSAGQVASGCNSSPITTTIVFDKSLSILLPFLDYYLKGICTSGNDLENAYNNITAVSKQRACLPYPACGILPVSLLSFTANTVAATVHLGWSTSGQFNLRQFNVEKSTDAVNFKMLDVVFPTNLDGSGSIYKLIDEFPFDGENFYRLNMIDLDGSSRYSPVITSNVISAGSLRIRVFPNPLTDRLTLETQSKQEQSLIYNLFDLNGHKLASSETLIKIGLARNSINFEKFPGGTYILQVLSKEGLQVGKFQLYKR